MKSRQILLLLVLASLFESCTAPSNLSIIVGNARFPGTSCDFSDPTLFVESGALDMSVYGTNSSYFQDFSWQNDLEDISVTYGSSAITAETPNTFIANTIQLSYQLVPPQGLATATVPSGLVNISAAIEPGGTFTTNYVGVYFLTPEAAAAIYPVVKSEAIRAQKAVSYTLLVTFDLAGTLVGGGAAQTNSVTYPLYVFYGIAPVDGLLCPNGTQSQVTSCGIPGRDIPYCVCTGVFDGGAVPCPPIT